MNHSAVWGFGGVCPRLSHVGTSPTDLAARRTCRAYGVLVSGDREWGMHLAHDHHPGLHSSSGHITLHSARAYEAATRIVWLGRRGRAYRRLVEDARVRPGDDVLDLGCGTGALTRAAAEASRTGRVTGIDLAPEMVAHARRLGGAASYREGDISRLTHPDASVDVVVSSLALHHVDPADRDAVLTGAFRVLRPNGRLLIAEFVPPRWLPPAARRHPMMAADPRGDLVERVARAGFGAIESRRRGIFAIVRATRP